MRIDKTAYNYHEAPLVILASFFYLFKFIIIAINCRRVLFYLLRKSIHLVCSYWDEKKIIIHLRK